MKWWHSIRADSRMAEAVLLSENFCAEESKPQKLFAQP
jgi:hypothetical protein